MTATVMLSALERQSYNADAGTLITDDPDKWKALTRPCPTCGGKGQAHISSAANPPPFGDQSWATNVPCPGCVAGRPVIYITDTCPNCDGAAGTKVDGEWFICWECDGGSVLVARVKARLYPVVAKKEWMDGVSPCVAQDPDGSWWLLIDGVNECHYWMPVETDPAPVPGGWLVVLEVTP